jgi:Spy/CpxP family protein refolding chaperone
MSRFLTRGVVLPAVIVVALAVAAAPAEGAQGRGGGAANPDAVSPGEIQRMFDAYALLQAQEQLRISDDQYSQFLARFKALQDARRRGQQEHNRAIQELRLLVNSPQADEAQLKEKVKALEDLDARSAADVKRAADALDQVLDPRQQARFRVFEQNMEQRKLELVTRARLANRPRQ